MNGWQFSANMFPDALMDGVSQFDVIDGGLCRFAALAFAEIDAAGSVNVSKFGKANPGSGGFVDIAMAAQRLVFTGTFTTGGLEIECEARRLHIKQEGRVSKFVQNVQSITYNVANGVTRGQTALIITERAVFEVTPEGLVLLEIAPGIELQRDVLDLMLFGPVRIEDPLKFMDASLFDASPANAPQTSAIST